MTKPCRACHGGMFPVEGCDCDRGEVEAVCAVCKSPAVVFEAEFLCRGCKDELDKEAA